jgi:ketosteroid isomerase-like protein
MSTETEVRNVSEQFYNALNSMLNGDTGPMADVWSHSTSVTTMHPIGERQIGWDAVKESFEQVAQLSSGGKIGLKDQFIQAVGDVAYEIGIENGQFKLAGQKVTIEHRVTNIYCLESGEWKITHHHTDVSPAMLEVIKPIQAEK